MAYRLVWLAAGTAVVIAAGVALFIDVHEGKSAGPAAELDDTARDRLASEAAIAQIAAESDIIDAPEQTSEPLPVASAPPGFEPAPALDHQAAPPAGYSFASHHGVKTAPMAASDYDRTQSTPPPAWMTFGPSEVAELASAQGRDWSFGWIKLADDADIESLTAVLKEQGGEVLGQSGDLVRARLPGDTARLATVTDNATVAGVGAVPATRKITDTLAERALANAGEEVPVWITLMDDDPTGRWRDGLQELGAQVGHFDPTIRTYAATITLDRLGPITAVDYVLAVESIGRVEPTLDRAAPAMGADAVRIYDESAGTFTGVGGASVPIGVMDTGLNVDHPDISSNRRSICGANFTNLRDAREEDQDLWYDFGNHGTHVTGIVVGNGAVENDRVGMAPLVQDIRIAKAISSYGSASALGWNRAMDWFTEPTACGDDIPRKALVINSSLGVSGDIWEGRSVVERKIDATAWTARQLFVTSAGNGADAVLSSMAGAKNALAVGAAQNIGDIAVFSSQGPTQDGRLLPKIVGTGVSISSTAGRGSRSGYAVASGTSMSSPAVVGVAALVMDALPELREEPAALRARLMASAIKPDAYMGDATAFPLDNTDGPGTANNVYGLGKVSARTAVLERDEADGWTGGSAAFDVEAGSFAYQDIVVPEGASRLDIVMTWDEPPAETIANPVLHDLDLWVDRGASCQEIGACGHYNSRSRVDNVEWVIVPNPAPGVYRLKVLPNRIYGTPPRAGLAWTVIRGDSTPNLSIAADTDRIEVAPEASFEVQVTMSSDSYVAAGANLQINCRAVPGSEACADLTVTPTDSVVNREDGLERSLARDGAAIVVGEIGPDEEQTVSLHFAGSETGSFRLEFSASGWNATGDSTSVAVMVGEPDYDPPAPAQRPYNDDFAHAMELDSTGGQVAFDLVAATPDPGEPPFALAAGHPSRERSLWYVWTAAETGLVRFGITPAHAGDYADLVVVEAYRDGPLAGLEAVGRAQIGGGTTFFANQGETYRLRLTLHQADLADAVQPEALMLSWGPASRPENDDYAMAAVIEGESGAVTGNNQGATTQTAEIMGHSNPGTPLDPRGWSSSVWYRWTAPATGDYRFSANRRSTVVAAFVGDGVGAARMVSGIPAQGPNAIVFPATEGVEYRIGVATGAAIWSGGTFELSWSPGGRELPGNDDVANAGFAFGNFALGTVDFNSMTVEHGEPPESGVRTAWWSWQAPADGRFTWLVTRAGSIVQNEAPFQMSAFAGPDVSSLELVASDRGDETIELQMALDVQAGTPYQFAVGLPRDAAQVRLSPELLIMEWGPTPDNDDRMNAATLAGMSGSVFGSNEFATTEKGEHTGTLGDASLWWSFEPDESGWTRFAVDGPRGSKLAIYEVGADGGLHLVTISRNLGTVSATLRVRAGTRYILRLGTYLYDAEGFGGGATGSFELSWGPTDAPALLRFVGSVEDGEIADNGMEVALGSSLGAQVLNGDGTELYLATDLGIQVFARDTMSGKLTPIQTLADHVLDSDTQMIWDDTGSALLVAACSGWMKFTPRDGGGIEHAGEIDGAPCPVSTVLVYGDHVHHVMKPWLIETFRFDADHNALSQLGVNAIPDVATAVITADGANIYALTDDDGDYALAAIERDLETGSLGISTIIQDGAETSGGTVDGLSDVATMSVHGSHLFVSAGAGGTDTLVFDLADRAQPTFIGNLEGFLSGFGNDCQHAVARSNPSSVDVVCSGGVGQAFTVQVGRDSAVMASDLVRATGVGSDAFGNVVDAFDDVLSVGASPDGRHLYVAGSVFVFGFDPTTGQLFFGDVVRLLTFERVFADQENSGDS